VRTRRSEALLLAGAFGAAALALAAQGALAQAARVEAAAGDDLRAAYANSAEVAEGKRVAQAQCAACHGMNGIGGAKGIPNIAGQRPAYLYRELQVYQSGGRGENPMSNAVKYLRTDAMYKVAAYYASLDPAQPVVTRKPAPPRPDPVAAGKAASAACVDCHGATGVTETGGTPSLAGLHPKYFAATLHAYKSGARKEDIMADQVKSLSSTAIDDLALYYALQKPARAKTKAAGDAAAGKAGAKACAGCHGDTGVSTSPANPSLAGQDAEYLAAALHAYKDGSRADDAMKKEVGSLDDAAIRNLAAFYAGQEPQAPKIQKPLTTAQWVERCDRCHGLNGNSTDPKVPALAAQREDYLARVLEAYRKGERKSPEMAAMSAVLTEADVESLAAYYSRQKARAVVYVMLPPR
jgi:cytochrome c553